MTEALGGSAWAADPLGDSEVALQQLRASAAAGPAPNLPTGGNQPLGGPTFDSTAQPAAVLQQNMEALLAAAAGAAALATQRVRDIDADSPGLSTLGSGVPSTASVLIRVGREVLGRLFGGDDDPDRRG